MNKNSLSFDPESHTYYLNGERIPCVSDLCRFLHKELYADAPKENMDAAAEKGTAVHEACETLDKYGTCQIDADYAGYILAYKRFLSEHDVAWQLIEAPIYDPADLYAGTVDRYGAVDGESSLVDIKTTYTVLKPLCGAQLALYQKALEANGIYPQKRYILHLKKDGTYKLISFPYEAEAAAALITLHKFTARRKRNVRRKKYPG